MEMSCQDFVPAAPRLRILTGQQLREVAVCETILFGRIYA